MIMGAIYYCTEIKRGIINPAPATFIIIAGTFSLSLFMYTKKPNWSFLANIGLSSAFISAWIICIYLSVKLLLEKKFLLSINKWQKYSLIMVSIIFGVWLITDNAFISYIMLQISALIGYIPVIQKLWKAKKNSESIIFWSSLMLSSMTASYAAYLKNDIEAWIYIFRAVPSTLLVIILILKAKKKEAIYQ